MLKTGALRALGTMSGTSLDGVDAAEIFTDGIEIFEFGETAYRPYSVAEREQIHSALGKWQTDDVEGICELIETVHAQLLSNFERPDLIGFHGQTLAHDPLGRGTHQAGSGAVLAEVLGCPVVWDFRSADVQMGGGGAPLAPFFHFACAKWIKAAAPLAFLNLGGVGNLTYIDPRFALPEEDGALLAFDTGPANAPIDDATHTRLDKSFDESGTIAGQGTTDIDVVERFLTDSFFFKMPPKSLDRDAFSYLQGEVRKLTDADAVATLTECCVASAIQGLSFCPQKPERLLVTGGGRKNTTIMDQLSERLDIEVLPVDDVGLDGDMLEAQAFAFLAVRVARGMPTSAPSTTGVRAAVGGGTMSRPETAV